MSSPSKKARQSFPIDLAQYKTPDLNPWQQASLSKDQKQQLDANIQLCRDAIVTFTACGAASGYGGHTGGAFDTAPEVCILDAMFESCPDKFVPTMYDEAGHRVATQYLFSAIRGHISPESLSDYRKGHANLPGHPELGVTPGVKFSSGRLGHMWPFCNGVSFGNADKVVVCLGSDGSQMEGNDAEAARIAVANKLNVKIIVDDNDVTIAGKPSQYQKGYSVAKTLRGHGMTVFEVDGEATADLYKAIQAAVVMKGPVAVVIHREMIPGVPDLEGTPAGHDVIPVKNAIAYLEKRGLDGAIELIRSVKGTSDPHQYQGCGARGSIRVGVSEAMVREIGKLSAEERKRRVLAIDSDLEGSTGLVKIRQAFPEIVVKSGIMERGNFSAAAGFGSEPGKQGIFSTFCAFLEMCLSEVFMARMGKANVLCHFSHSGCDDMADNTCHFGMNPFFADNGAEEHGKCGLYMPGDPNQINKIVERIFWDQGIRFIFSLRSKIPQLLRANGEPYYTDNYTFHPGKDEPMERGSHGYVVACGDALYRAHDAVMQLRKEGVDVGLVNKPHLNAMDVDTLRLVGRTYFVLVVEPLNYKTGLGLHYGYWLAKLGLSPVYDHIGIKKEGSGGLWEHAYHQGYDSLSIQKKIKEMRHLASQRQRHY